MNSITLVGNLAADPELHYTPGGHPVARLTIAVNRRSQASGDYQLDGFFTCVAWRSLAEHIAEAAAKGTRMIVTGRLTQRSWEAEDGSRRYAVEVQVEDAGISLRFTPVRSGDGESA